MTTTSLAKVATVLVAGLILALYPSRAAHAQTGASPSNSGALTLAANADVPSVYVFRGIVQETDPAFTLLPSFDVGIAAGARSVVNIGTWHALLTESSGSDGPTGRLHYQENFYATFGLTIGHGLAVGSTYTAYTSPNSLFNTVQELSVKLSTSGLFGAYALAAFELSGAADGRDTGTGSYLELGAGPAIPLRALGSTLRVPVRVGLSLDDYYEGVTRNPTFGYLELGAHLSVPLGAPGRFGSWNLHGGADLYVFGDTTKPFNSDNTTRIVPVIGVGVTY